MVLCEIANLTASPLVDFAITWAVLTLLGGVSMALLSGSVFWLYYANPTYERWQRKHNPEFPTARKVRLEIRQMLKSLMAATLVPAATLLLSQERFRHLGLTQAYCGLAPPQGMAVPWGLSPAAYLAAQFAVFWVASDFFEWGYHQIGHRFSWCWAIHRHHHVCACSVAAPRVRAPWVRSWLTGSHSHAHTHSLCTLAVYNPSPFSVISDEAADQLVRTAPLILLPWLMPANIDLLFAQFAVLFYGYGVYLHWVRGKRGQTPPRPPPLRAHQPPPPHTHTPRAHRRALTLSTSPPTAAGSTRPTTTTTTTPFLRAPRPSTRASSSSCGTLPWARWPRATACAASARAPGASAAGQSGRRCRASCPTTASC